MGGSKGDIETKVRGGGYLKKCYWVRQYEMETERETTEQWRGVLRVCVCTRTRERESEREIIWDLDKREQV